MRKSVNGFTIVEVLVVIAIIGILATFGFSSFTRYQASTRDTQRLSKTTILAEALEKYYDQNGEYPGCLDIVKDSAIVTTTILPGLSVNILLTPNSASGDTNSIKCTDLTGDSGEADIFAYVGDGSVACSSGSACLGWTLKYKDEITGTIKSMTSRRYVAGAKPVWATISAARYHTCAVDSNGKAYCWGYNGQAQLGNNSTTNSKVPVAVDTSGVLSGKTIVSIATGGAKSCAVDSNGKAYCWGDNGYGGLGNNSTTSSSVPVAVDTSGVLSGKAIASISAGGSQTCAVTYDSKAYCWGRNVSGELGNNSTTSSSVPVAVDTSGVLSGKAITKMTTAGFYSCALDSGGKAYCWGYAFNKQFGNPQYSSLIPTAVDTSGALSGKTIVSIGAAYDQVCVVTSDGKAYCWGGSLNNIYGYPDGTSQLGSTTIQSAVPIAVMSTGVLNGKTLVSISVGDNHSCVIDTTGKAYCWGGAYYGYEDENYNWIQTDYNFGELGNSTTVNSSNPVAVSGFSGGEPISSMSSNAHSCAVVTDGSAYCWGSNFYGQLGNNSTTSSSAPILVISP